VKFTIHNSQFQSIGDPRMKKWLETWLETCQERNGEAKSPKISYYGNDSSPEELKPGSRNLKTTINSAKFPQQFALMLWNVCGSHTKNCTKFQITKDDSMESQPYLLATENSHKLPRKW